MNRGMLGLAGKVMLLGALLSGGQFAWAGNVCGDGTCQTGETYCDCPADCVNDEFSCELCECDGPGGPAEDCWCDDDCVGFGDCCFNSCEVCGHCPGICGVNGCEADEDCFSCPLDCGECTGACCFENDALVAGGSGSNGCEQVTENECLDRNGSYHGDLTTCSPNPCIFGACCSGAQNRSGVTAGEPSGCREASEADCVFSGGFFQGEDTSCQNVICPEFGACCLPINGDGGGAGLVAGGGGPIRCTETTEATCESAFGGTYLGDDTSCDANRCIDARVSSTQKGSLLIFSKVELAWIPAAGGTWALSQDTVLELTNDYPFEVDVQLYFINGDEPLDPVFAGDPPMLITEGEPGWNWVDCQISLTADQPTYWSAADGLAMGCQPFTVLDPDAGAGPGRLDVENPGRRVLRGFVYAWAVDSAGFGISWNHLSGSGTLISYADQSAWEYEAWGFQSHAPQGVIVGDGILAMDGFRYDLAFDMLLLDFFASGSQPLSSNGAVVTSDTDLTLHPVSADLRQDSFGPVTTKAEFAIWNENEIRFSGTTRCITCWDQTLLSNYSTPNHFLLNNLQTNRGKARINGVASDACDVNCIFEPTVSSGTTAGLFDFDVVCSEYAALLGVSAKVLAFSGTATGRTHAGGTLVGQGQEPAFIVYDIIAPPGTATKALRPLRNGSR